ncbi:hypothetical protein [Cohnella sp. GCM10027633]|uniref:hypothetical protein n=1 Tax=unclassified Cohnella TaxID=2636738 RepID=UPI0036419B6E
MRNNLKKRLIELLDTVMEMVSEMKKMSSPQAAANDCVDALNAILYQLDQDGDYPKSKEQLEGARDDFIHFTNGDIVIHQSSLSLVYNKVKAAQSVMKHEVKGKLNVLFLPYKASMWDSLESIYKAASQDSDCEATVVPIPYYQLTQTEAIPTYEGHLLPPDVPVTHYSKYDLEYERPDIIFVHNIYDQYNTITRVQETYFSSNLKSFTDMLVYVPYHVSSFILPEDNKGDRSYDLLSIQNVDRVVVMNEALKNAAIKFGVPRDKILALGSPKLDAMVNTLKQKNEIPIEWQEKVKDKRVYLINTECLFFATETHLRVERLTDFLNIPRIDENSVVIWRPHPLTTSTIMKYSPSFLPYYLNLVNYIKEGDNPFYKHIIFDDSPDYFPALQLADVLVTADGSLLRSYLLTERKVLYWSNTLPKTSLVPENAFYYIFDETTPWFESVRMFAKGLDPLSENRKGLAEKIYTNADGTSGEKIYRSVKESLPNK